MITTDQAHAGEEDGEGNPVVDSEGDVVGGRLVLLEEVVLHPAHHVHCFVLLIRLQGRSHSFVSFQETFHEMTSRKLCEGGLKKGLIVLADKQKPVLLSYSRRIDSWKGIYRLFFSVFTVNYRTLKITTLGKS